MPPKKKAASKKEAAPKEASKELVPKKKRGAPPKYDWDTAARLFIEGVPEDPDDPDGSRDWLNLRQLSERTGIRYESMRAKSSSERWAAQRAEYQRKSAAERAKKRAQLLGTQSVEFDGRMYDQAKVATQLIGVRLGEIAREVNVRAKLRQEAEEKLKEGLPVDKTDLYSAVRYTEMRELAQAASMWQDIGRKALGTDIQQVHIDVEATVDAQISVSGELERDDPDRLAAFMAAAERAGILDELMGGGDIVDAEYTEDEADDEGDDE